ncbi:hypothetical protein GCM10008995_17690 [Halobellus salinus]|uniref:Uncharacterized protein n=1 Tax=Halobellus salinus TaxID=931585 RepID=A0A830EGQ9_9EURY|nr:DUF5518 domain-containing protein [Halobellus salinus]GGJ08289.1 hypothetical protein GCM10008995_17690 [Halobellus salinus]SMP28013.1 hypothetical protein SAMN06265347_11341 [Halobellus salinus]
MARWRAVGAGFALAASSEALVFAMTGRVTLIGGLAGSALAGYVVGEELAEGAWHGLLTAMAWGIVLIPGLVVLSVVTDAPLPFPIEFLVPLLDTAGEATALLLLSASLPNVAAGAFGSLTRRQDDRKRSDDATDRQGQSPSGGDAEET